jgi:hypothetical protein
LMKATVGNDVLKVIPSLNGRLPHRLEHFGK